LGFLANSFLGRDEALGPIGAIFFESPANSSFGHTSVDALACQSEHRLKFLDLTGLFGNL
jgi:hypothetical protein